MGTTFTCSFSIYIPPRIHGLLFVHCLRFFSFHKLKGKMANIETFNLNEVLVQYFDYYDIDDLAKGLGDDSTPIVGPISMFNAPFARKNISTLSNLHLKVNVEWEVLKI
jgi:hypothetical protein